MQYLSLGLHDPAHPAMELTQFIVSHREQALLLGDYNAYRAQLSRQILSLRRKLGRTTAKGKKYAPPESITKEDVKRNHE
jgi:signal recognition particle subunit SRP68